jgi:hypothetical protein
MYQRSSKRHRHKKRKTKYALYSFPKRRHTVRVVIEMATIIILISTFFHFLHLQPCGENNPITWFRFMFDFDHVAAQCAREIAHDKIMLANELAQEKLNNSAIPISKLDQVKINTFYNKYEKYIPASGKLTTKDLQNLPPEAKAMCDSNCRKLLKEYLKNHGGKIDLRPYAKENDRR